jgi:general secretion pathway protein F
MLTALGIAKNVTGNSLIADDIDSVAVEVGKGGGLSENLARYDYFSGLPVQMVTVGEQGGQLEEMLEKVSTIYEQEAESRIVGLASLLEPLMILVMGVIIGFIVLSICLPIFEMNQLIG